MIVEKLCLRDFRNYQDINLKFHPNINILVGNNAQGKTNIIEAIYMSALGKSYRTNKDYELIRWDQPLYRIVTDVKDGQRSVHIELSYNNKGQKNLKVNGVSKNRLVDIIGNLRAVIFTPEDLMLIKSGPSLRRKFMDSNISQVSPTYLYNLQQYTKILDQKNSLLRSIKNKNEDRELISIWNNQLAQFAAAISKKRLEFISQIKTEASRIHSLISAKAELLELIYRSGTNVSNEDIANFDINKLKHRILNELEAKVREECVKGYSMLGPQRDDVSIFLNGLEAKSFGSQGQQRTSVLSLKLAEVQYIKDQSDEFPVLLLDDVMSELDQKRRSFLLDSVLDRVQIFITTTDLEYVNERVLGSCYTFNVSEGKVILAGG